MKPLLWTVLIVLTIFGSGILRAQTESAERYFVSSGYQFTEDKISRALDIVDAGLQQYPGDERLQALKDEIEKEREKKKQQQKQSNQNQDKKNQQQQDKQQDQDKSEGQKNEQEQKSQQQNEEDEVQSEDNTTGQQNTAGDTTGQMAQPRQMKPLDKREAEQILNALRLNQNKVMKAQIQKKLKNVETEKDW